MVYLVLRIRGEVNVSHWAEKTLESLNLRKKFNATIIKEDSQTLGMLRKVKELVAWKSVDAPIINELLEKRGKVSGLRLLTNDNLPKNYSSLNELANTIYENNLNLSDVESIKPWFSLNPPKGGFKRKTKTQFTQKGVLGENNDLTELIRRMI
ncbi:MAG: 50S ribosomal protein L30 [Nitrososphaeraceae archaeon]